MLFELVHAVRDLMLAVRDKSPGKLTSDKDKVQAFIGDKAEFNLKLARILNAPPEPYTRERFDHTYQWTLGWGLVAPGATYENTVDNRAWQ